VVTGDGVVVGGAEVTGGVVAVVAGTVAGGGAPVFGVVVRVVPPGELPGVAPPGGRVVTVVDDDRDPPLLAGFPLGTVPVAPVGLVVGVVTDVEFDVAALASRAASAK